MERPARRSHGSAAAAIRSRSARTIGCSLVAVGIGAMTLRLLRDPTREPLELHEIALGITALPGARMVEGRQLPHGGELFEWTLLERHLGAEGIDRMPEGGGEAVEPAVDAGPLDDGTRGEASHEDLPGADAEDAEANREIGGDEGGDPSLRAMEAHQRAEVDIAQRVRVGDREARGCAERLEREAAREEARARGGLDGCRDVLRRALHTIEIDLIAIPLPYDRLRPRRAERRIEALPLEAGGEEELGGPMPRIRAHHPGDEGLPVHLHEGLVGAGCVRLVQEDPCPTAEDDDGDPGEGVGT